MVVIFYLIIIEIIEIINEVIILSSKNFIIDTNDTCFKILDKVALIANL